MTAIFRGVAFHVETSELSGGRRGPLHEFPQQDAAYVEDMGRKARSFPVEGYVIGDDAEAQRDTLIAALEQEGPGELVHPSYGVRLVAVSTFRVRVTNERRIFRFSVEFTETEAAPAFPAATPAPAVATGDRAAAAEAAAQAAFVRGYDVAGLPNAAIESLGAVVASAAAQVKKALAPLVLGTESLSALSRDLDDLALDAVAVARQPLKVTARLVSVLAGLATLPVVPSMGARALLASAAYVPGSERPPATTSTRRQERACYDALDAVTRTVLVTQAARMAAVGTYESYDEAIAMRDAVAEAIDERMEAADDETYSALQRLRAAFVQALPAEGARLPRLMRYTPEVTVPSLVLAHRLYGSIDRERDIVARNRVRHPGFIVGGVELEVLSNA